jgi:hypothetical protein
MINLVKRGNGIPTKDNISGYQLGLDYVSGDLYINNPKGKNNAGEIVYIGGNRTIKKLGAMQQEIEDNASGILALEDVLGGGDLLYKNTVPLSKGNKRELVTAVDLSSVSKTSGIFTMRKVDIDNEERRFSAMEYLTRANYGLTLGNFEMDLFDGEVRFRAHLPAEMMVPSIEVVSDVIEAGPLHWDIYGDGFVHIINGTTTPSQAIAKIEDFEDELINSEIFSFSPTEPTPARAEPPEETDQPATDNLEDDATDPVTEIGYQDFSTLAEDNPATEVTVESSQDDLVDTHSS